MTASDKADATLAIRLSLATECRSGQVFRRGVFQLGTVATPIQPSLALLSMVADASAWPHVVKCPNNLFPRVNDAAYVAQREHTLVYPSKMNDIGFAETLELSDVGAVGGSVYRPKVFAAEAIGKYNLQPFGAELRLQKQTVLRQHLDVWILRLTVANKNLRLLATIVQRSHKAAGSYRRPANAFRCIHQKYLHLSITIVRRHSPAALAN